MPKPTSAAGTKVHSVYSDVKGSAQLNLRLPWPRALTIQYGKAGFDGCGPLHPRQVSVAGMPAVVNSSKLHTSDKYDGRTYTTLVWPATAERTSRVATACPASSAPSGLIAFAESMERARAAKPRGPKTNC